MKRRGNAYLRLRALPVALALGLTGCVQQGATEAEKRATLHAWISCVRQAADQLDDGRSDPVSIAFGIEPVCAGLYGQFTEAVVASVTTEDAMSDLRRLYASQELPLIATVVLIRRAKEAPPPATEPVSDKLLGDRRARGDGRSSGVICGNWRATVGALSIR